jgi:hypothetical protein
MRLELKVEMNLERKVEMEQMHEMEAVIMNKRYENEHEQIHKK